MSEITVIPFRMQCPGCQAKVVVKHKELLGKSLPCPKCKHLIIVPKQGPISNLGGAPTREAAPSFDSTALTKDDYGDWDEVLSNLPQNPLGVDPEQIDWSPIEPKGAASDSNIPFQPINTAPPQPSTASDWQDKAVKKRRQLLLVATIGVLSSLLAGVGFFGFLSFMKNDSAAQASNNQQSDDNKAGAVGNPDDGGKSSQGDSPKTDSDVPPIEDSTPPDSTPNEQIGQEKTGDGGPIVIPSTKTNDSNAAGSNESGTSDASSGSEAGLPETGASNDPTMASGSKPDEPKADANDIAVEMAYKLPPELSRVKDLLNNSRGAFGSDAGFSPPASSIDGLDIENLQYPLMDIFHPDAQILGDWKQSASLRIPRMSAPNDVSLAIGLEEFARMTNIGITIDWQNCRAMGIELNPLISLRFENKTISEFIDETLASKGLTLSLDAKGFPSVKPASILDKQANYDPNARRVAILGSNYCV
ncbi:MAG: hypothetical protein MUC83_15780 [Pirellula sp.]|nr:hypothetical protein [Pirellula sp.]